MNIILLGAPGAGKGTQGKKISKEFNIPHISVGELLRESDAYTLFKGFMDLGELVPNHLVEEVVLQRLEAEDCEKGFILDGYPRTLEQACRFYKHIDAVIDLQVSSSIAKRRLVQRGREGESMKVVDRRLSVYKENANSISDHYRYLRKSIIVAASDDPDMIYDTIRTFLEVCKV